ncbi:ArsR family transcriptional regulator [archaeon]|nr:ArsR family transcriptional regulator [archaeon]
MEKIKKNVENFDKIKVFSSDDEKLKILGELLSNKSSRDMIKLLIEKEMYTNEIAKKLGLRVNLIIHHLKKLEGLGLLEITEKQIVKKGNNHKFYKMVPNFFISPNADKNETCEKGFFKKIFKDGIKFASIGIISFVSWAYLRLNSTESYMNNSQSDNLAIPLVIIIVGLIVLLFLKKKKSYLR